MMPQKSRKRKRTLIPVEKYYGIISRIARQMGKSKALISRVNSGHIVSRHVKEALLAEWARLRAAEQGD